MANWIDTTYFFGPLSIAQIDQPAVIANVNWFISMYEKDYLIRILGKALYDAAIAGLAEVTPAAKWTTLKSKFLIVQETAKVSPIANYVYWRYMNNQESATTGSGEKKLNKEHSKIESARYKIYTAWKLMIDLNISIRAWLRNNTGDYPEYVEPRSPFYTVGWPYGSYREQANTFRQWNEMFITSNPYF